MNPLDATRPALREATRTDPCVNCGSRLTGLCQPLDAAALDDISADSERFAQPARSVLFREGDQASRAFSISSGVVKLSRLLADGKQQVVGFRFPGDIVGYGAAATYPYDAELLTSGAFCKIERRRLDTLLRRYPVMERRLLDMCLAELAATQEHLVTVGRRSAEARVASFLLGLEEAWRRRGALPDPLPMPMTRSDIGDFLGLTLETVSRTFTAFKKAKWVEEPAHQKLRIRDRQTLADLAEGVVQEF
ncbi:Crp/Fnr family transcriptional regulator [Roseococcus sp. DSY-14]|uniref:Crp/Fnr family transcriptional regulator n=1 Tax=Roseococcus sp. DSY-14 TaxID=3369650 RepID=UPI00387B48F7